MSGAILRRRDRTVRSLRVEHYSSAVNIGASLIPPAFRRDPRVRDSCAELLQRQSAPDYAVADDESRHSPDAQSIGEDGVPRDQRIQGRVLHVARKPFGIEADGAGDGEDVIEVEGASAPSSAR